jgi:hypothetical protein
MLVLGISSQQITSILFSGVRVCADLLADDELRDSFDYRHHSLVVMIRKATVAESAARRSVATAPRRLETRGQAPVRQKWLTSIEHPPSRDSFSEFG